MRGRQNDFYLGIRASNTASDFLAASQLIPREEGKNIKVSKNERLIVVITAEGIALILWYNTDARGKRSPVKTTTS